MMEEKLALAFDESVQIIKFHSKSFYKAFKMLDEKKFLAVASLYAFFRSLDDIADEISASNKDDSLKKLYDLEKDLLAIYEKKDIKSPYPWWPAFEKTIKDYEIDPKGFLMQIDGQKSDIDFKDIENREELIEYSKNVAGSVGRSLLPILSYKNKDDEKLLLACENLGIAMQITNILRDVGEDLKIRDRIYLPRELLADNKLDKEKIRNLIGTNPDKKDFKNFIKIWEILARLSESYYDSFLSYLFMIDKDCQLAVHASALIYRSIMDEIRKNNYDCLNKKQAVSNAKKLSLIKKAREDLKILN